MENDRYTQRSHWPDGHWCVPLVQFADEQGVLPQDGQFVPQAVIDRLAFYESIGSTEDTEEIKALGGRKTMELKVKLEEGAFMPERAHPTDAGLDLRCREEVIIDPSIRMNYLEWDDEEKALYYPNSEFSDYCCAAIDTGVHVEIPHGYYGKIESKSGLNRKHNIVCCGGVIDENYRGSIVVMVYNFGNGPYIFQPGEKICQLVIQPYIAPEVVLVESLGESDRGENGFGSTGK